MKKEYYQYYKAHGLCTRCRTEKAEPGYTTCLPCRMDERERDRERHVRHRESDNERNLERMNRQRAERRATGICPRCGKRKPEPGKTTCEVCLAKARKHNEASRRRRGVMPACLFGNGEYCHLCGKPVDNTKLCPTCLEKVQANAKKARESEGAQAYRQKMKSITNRYIQAKAAMRKEGGV